MNKLYKFSMLLDYWLYNQYNVFMFKRSKTNESNEKDIIFKINPITEGECEVYIKATNGIESNKIKLKIVDNDRIEKEKKEAEEQAQKEAEQKRAEEEKAKQEESTQKSQQTTTQKNTSNSQTTSNKDNSRTVYRTPTGKRYHYDPDCGGKNSYSTTLNAAKSSGLTPCQKCAK